MRKGFLQYVSTLIACSCLNAFAADFISGVVKETHQFFPADESKPSEFTFALENNEKYILYTQETVVLMSEQEIKVEKSPTQDHKERTVVCSLRFERLVVATENGDKHFIEMDAPKVHQAAKGHGC